MVHIPSELCKGEAELEVVDYTPKLLSSFREVISILVFVVPVVSVPPYLKGMKSLQLSLLSEQRKSASPCEVCIAMLSAHTVSMIYFTFCI